MKNSKITVAVTGLNNIDSPGPGIPVIRALKESTQFDVRIIGLSYETLEPGIYMKELVDKTYQIPLPTAGSTILFDRLNYINNIENIDLIIPNFDAELHNFIRIKEQLKKECEINTFLPTLAQFESRHKSVLQEFGKGCGVKVPMSKMIFSANEIYSLGDEFSFPIVIKGKYYDAFIARTAEQAIQYFHKIVAQWGTPVILQEFIAGNEVNVTALGDGKGNCIGAIPMRKLFITDKGKAWSGVVLEDNDLIEITKKVIRFSNWKGGCELEFIKSSKSEYYMIEMNPRFPAWIYLAVGCGQNHPEKLVELALGKKVEPYESYKTEKMFIRYSYDRIVDLKDFETISTTGEL